MPAVGHHQAPRAGPASAGEGALHVAEQLQLQRSVGERGAAERDERAVGPRGPGVDGARQPLLPAARLAADQDGCPGLRHLAGPAEQRLHLCAPHPRVELGCTAELLLQEPGVGVVLLVQTLEGERLPRALHRDGQELGVHLDQVHHRRRVDLAHAAVEREDAQRLIAGDQRRDETGVARAEGRARGRTDLRRRAGGPPRGRSALGVSPAPRAARGTARAPARAAGRGRPPAARARRAPPAVPARARTPWRGRRARRGPASRDHAGARRRRPAPNPPAWRAPGGRGRGPPGEAEERLSWERL